MTLTDRIEINPKVMLGKPVIRGTRIPVELILRKLSDGASEADILDGYPALKREAASIDTNTLDRGISGSSGSAASSTIRNSAACRWC